MQFHPRMREHYELADIRTKTCPRCEGIPKTTRRIEPWLQPEPCEECGGDLVVPMRVNVYRKRYRKGVA